MYMKKFFITLIISFLCNQSILIAQSGTIRGIIYDGQDPLPFALVVVNEKGTSTNQQGEFVFKGLSAGKYLVRIYHIGFNDTSFTTELFTGNEKIELGRIRLNRKSITIDEVVVKPGIENFDTRFKGTSNVISQKELKQVNPAGTEEVLKTIPGLNVAGDMGISNRLNVGIRGSYPRRAANILVLEDGIAIAPAPYLAPEAYYNPPAERLDGIEVIKGADVITYGNNTKYGVINYITKRPPTKPTLMADLSGGSRGYNSQFLSYGGSWNNTGAELQLLHKGFNGYQDNSQSEIFNTTFKIFTEMSKRSSFYLKMNYHKENSKATYSGLTPYTFNTDPRQNPYDADDLSTNRIAADLIYNFAPVNNLVFTSQVYASRFERGWWRQNTSLIKAKDAAAYLGEEIVNSRYSYLQNATFGEDDWVRVGKINKGRESTLARNREFLVAGGKETMKYSFEIGKTTNMIEVGAAFHAEQFGNREIANDSSRFSRSGNIGKDELYNLTATSGYIRYTLGYKRLKISPALRGEMVKMTNNNLFANAKLTDPGKHIIPGNTFTSIIPAFSINYNVINLPKTELSLYAGIYKGYTPPTSDAGFIAVNEDNTVNTKPKPDEINMTPETSTNIDGGLRGYSWDNFVSGQLAVFRNNIQNYYSAGRSEAFQTLGSVTIQGIESGIDMRLDKLVNMGNHRLKAGSYITIMQSEVTSGKLQDGDILKAKHTNATKEELLNKINNQREGFDVYFKNKSGKDSLVNGEVSAADFAKISRLDYNFGKNGISGNAAPYIPAMILNFKLSYEYKNFAAGVIYNYVSEQYTDYLNLSNETAEGAVGKLDAFRTIDLNFSYSFTNINRKFLNGLSIYTTIKNIEDNVYKASRLHRVSSGIMPGGFRQINAGLRITI